jgi:hypothetical protein
MQGEMSATVFYHPGSYEKLLPIMKKRILRGKPESMYGNVETGKQHTREGLVSDIHDWPFLWESLTYQGGQKPDG